MCHKKPGPRCVSHARADLKKALASGDPVCIAAAQEDYDSTVTGQREIQARIDACSDGNERANLLVRLATARSIRDGQLAAYYEAYPEVSPEAKAAVREKLTPGYAAQQECRRLYRSKASRLAAASDPATPATHLDVLAQTDDIDVVRAVCQNSSVHRVTLERLARSDNSRHRSQVALSPYAPEDVLLTLAADHEVIRTQVRHRGRWIASTTMVAWTLIRQSPALTASIVRAVAEAPGAPDSVVRAAQDHPLYEVDL